MPSRALDLRPRGGSSGDAISAGSKATSLVVDTTNGQVLATINEIGASDIVTYNPGDGRYYLAASNMTSDGTKHGAPAATLRIVDSKSLRWIHNVSTGTPPPTRSRPARRRTTSTSRSLARASRSSPFSSQ